MSTTSTSPPADPVVHPRMTPGDPGRGTEDTRSCRPAQLALILASLAIVSAAAPAAAQTPITACPFATTGPSNYEVIQNLTSASNCITIAHDHVSIDLKGHTIEGAGGDGSGAAIIDNGVARQGIIMHNGTIQKFAVGVHLNFSDSSPSTVSWTARGPGSPWAPARRSPGPR